ncbi:MULTISPECIES: hypothetical protein [unclassified Clostridium]|uniref:hypothetical protein n=1 Tax=unclassified Clostridium TaxID=2614128 RepID=UPI000297A7D4|nr:MULTISPECIES: hypothetical protein [unclassified Clostridium]EKQ55809.1 MAG: hypothetical protein A370_02524 [Clostridium sp. Maddingley MBC34-26]
MICVFDKIKFNIKRGYYRYIGSGSCRDVFDLGNGYIIKVARNMAGIAQNKCEYSISCYDNSDLFAKVVKVSNDFNLLIMEKADKVYDLSYVCMFFDVRNTSELIKSKDLRNIKQDYNLLLDDLERASSWGTIKGRPVIIDYGFTKDVWARYY